MTGGNSGSGLNNSNSNVAGGGSNSGVNVTKAPSKGMSKAGKGKGQPSGYVGGSKQIQVFFNGKIVTPQSLAPKKRNCCSCF